MWVVKTQFADRCAGGIGQKRAFNTDDILDMENVTQTWNHHTSGVSKKSGGVLTTRVMFEGDCEYPTLPTALDLCPDCIDELAALRNHMGEAPHA